jgi:hypothetical protein
MTSFLLPLTTQQYDPNKVTWIVNELSSTIATKIVPFKTYDRLDKDAGTAATVTLRAQFAAEDTAERREHDETESVRTEAHQLALAGWNALDAQQQQGQVAPAAPVPNAFVVRVRPADEIEARTELLQRTVLAELLAYAASTPAAIKELYEAAAHDNLAKRTTVRHTTALQAAIPDLTSALKRSARIQAHTAAVAVIANTVLNDWRQNVQKYNPEKLASAAVKGNQAILKLRIEAATASDNLTDHCEAYELLHPRATAGFAHLLAASVLEVLEPAFKKHLLKDRTDDKIIVWAALSQEAFVEKMVQQAKLFLHDHPDAVAAAAAAPMIAAIQVELAALRVENKRLAENQRQQQQRQQPAQQAPAAVAPAPAGTRTKPFPPGHPQYTGCAFKMANGRRCGAMDHGWSNHPS